MSTHSATVLDGSADLSVVCPVFLAKRYVILSQHMAVAGHFGARLAHHSTIWCVCASAALQAKEDAHCGQHVEMRLAWHWEVPGTAGNAGTMGVTMGGRWEPGDRWRGWRARMEGEGAGRGNVGGGTKGEPGTLKSN